MSTVLISGKQLAYFGRGSLRLKDESLSANEVVVASMAYVCPNGRRVEKVRVVRGGFEN